VICKSVCYNLQVNARILFVDPSTRAVGLTLNRHLLHLEVPPIVSCLVLLNNQFDEILVVALLCLKRRRIVKCNFVQSSFLVADFSSHAESKSWRYLRSIKGVEDR
jgi:hypothetical protein